MGFKLPLFGEGNTLLMKKYRLEELCTFNRGTPLTSKQAKQGSIPVISGGKKPAFFHNESNRAANTIIIAGSGAYAGYVSYWDTPVFCSDSFSVDIKDPSILDAKYLYHYLLKNQDLIYDKKTGGGVPHVHGSDLKNMIITVPSLEVQKEIVFFLDSFAKFTSELTLNLTSELTARKKQYEYYRDKLLTFDYLSVEKKVEYNVRCMKLGEIATIVRGASPRPIQSYITSDDDGVNWIKIGDVLPGEKYITSCKEKITQEGANKSRLVSPGDFILSNSMSFGRPYISKIKGCIHDGWLSISNFEDYVISDYLYYLLNSTMVQQSLSQRASSGTVQNLNADIVKSTTITIPDKKTQTEIVSILDHYNAICNELLKIINCEIETRNKQYRYYLDKILSFGEE